VRPAPCAQPALPGRRALPLATREGLFGFALITVSEEARFAPYDPFVRNLVGALAGALADRWRRRELEAVHEEVRRHRDELERLVAERTAALQTAGARIEHLNAVLRGLQRVNHVVVRETDADAMAQRVCAVLAESGGFLGAWIGLRADGPDGALRLAGAAGPAGPGPGGAGAGAAGRAARLAELRRIDGRLASSDVKTIFDLEPDIRTDGGAGAGPGASAPQPGRAVRIRHHDEDFGILLVAVDDTWDDRAETDPLLREVAEDVGLALHHHAEERLRARAEESLRASRESYRTVLDTSPDAIVLASASLTIRVCNPKAALLAGKQTPDELVGLPLLDLVAPEDRERAAVDLRGALAGGRLEAAEYRIARPPHGPEVVGQLAASAIAGPDGAASGLIAVLRDVSERKRLEAQFQAAQRSEAISRLAGGVAHDFNNLLTVILSYGEFLLEDLAPGHPARRGAEQILDAAGRAARLTRQLLAFARRQVVQPVVIDLNEVVANLDRMLRRIIGEDIALVLRPADDLGLVRADLAQLEQVLMNLAVNARDAMPRGGTLVLQTANVELDVAWTHEHPDTPPGRYVALTVRDTGTGMSPEVLAHAFEPFFTTKAEGQGTGLGLATVLGIVKQSGGAITAESEPGAGSAFHVYLPRVEAARAEHVVLPPVRPRGGSETVMVVEDDPAVRGATTRILRRAGYTVVECAAAGDALLLVERPIHLLLTDVVMPQMSGRELAERVHSARPDLPVLFMSGYAGPAVDAHGELPPGTWYLEKPFTEVGLLAQVRTVLDTAGAAPTAAAS
jgi:PAS domain S-box-containing protein